MPRQSYNSTAVPQTPASETLETPHEERTPKPAEKTEAVEGRGNNPFERLLTLRNAASLLGMHWKTLETMARQRRVPAFRISGRWRFRASMLNKWLEEKCLVFDGQREIQWNKPVALRESEEK